MSTLEVLAACVAFVVNMCALSALLLVALRELERAVTSQ